jgi:predicted nucleotidyltransferase
MLSVKAPGNPDLAMTIAIMRDIDAVAKALGLRYFICGATARDLLLTQVHGIKTGIATEDIDFGIAVADWAQFEALKKKLTETTRFKSAERITQRVFYKPTPESDGIPVDLIPFGGVEKPKNNVTWQPDEGVALNVIGYDEALDTATSVQIDAGFDVPVVSLPALALLKLFAWVDRGTTINSKDARDLAILFRHYANAGNEDRLYGELNHLMVAVEHDIDLAGPRLLGLDVSALATEDTRTAILQLIGDEKKMNTLVTHLAVSFRGHDDAIEAAEIRLAQFQAGLKGLQGQ